MNGRKILNAFLLFLGFWSTGQSTDVPESTTWAESKESGEANLNIYYHPVRPFIYEQNGGLTGVDYEIMQSLAEYLEIVHDLKINFNWIETERFNELFDKMEEGSSGDFAVAQLSITDERSERMKFAPAYFSDISVLLTSYNIPTALTEEELAVSLQGKEAISVPGSTLEEFINSLDKAYDLNAKVTEINSAGGILKEVESADNRFAYLDLPTYLHTKNNGGVNVHRQLFYPRKGVGISFGYPLSSDWEEVVFKWFNSANGTYDREEILKKYFGYKAIEVIGMISRSADIGPHEEIALLIREREIQNKKLHQSEIQSHKERITRSWLISGGIFVFLAALFFIYRLSVKARNNRALRKKQEEITAQNELLSQLNEEKKELLHVLANDIQDATVHISGLARIYIRDNESMTREQSEIIENILFKSDDMASMIGKIVMAQKDPEDEQPQEDQS